MKEMSDEMFTLVREALITVADRAYTAGGGDATAWIASMFTVPRKTDDEVYAMNAKMVDEVFRAAGWVE